jgi:hypothetical protein
MKTADDSNDSCTFFTVFSYNLISSSLNGIIISPRDLRGVRIGGAEIKMNNGFVVRKLSLF